MIVERRTWVVKRGCMDKLVALLKEESSKSRMTTRAYTPNVGHNGIFTVEFEFESLAEMEKADAEWRLMPETAGFLQKWNELTEQGGTREIFNLVFNK